MIIDVRSKLEFNNEGNINGSINIPIEKLAEHIRLFEDNQNIEIFIVCKSGNRARIAVDLLNELGYTNIVNGGGWESFSKREKK